MAESGSMRRRRGRARDKWRDRCDGQGQRRWLPVEFERPAAGFPERIRLRRYRRKTLERTLDS